MPAVSAVPIVEPEGTFERLSDSEVASANRFGGNAGIPFLGHRYNESKQAGHNRSQYWLNPIAADADYVLPSTAQPASGTTVVTTGITNPDFPRCLSVDGNQATCTGNLVVVGTDIDGNAITETIAINGTTLVAGTMAFKTITSITIPAQGASGDEIFVGVLDAMGLDRCLIRGNTVLLATIDGTRETTFPTVTFDAAVLAKNTVDPNTALNAARDLEVFWIDCTTRESAA